MVDLIQSGHAPPTAQEVAERAGVSPSSLFRYFADLDELRAHTIRRFMDRYDDLFQIPSIGGGPLDQRVTRYVAARVRLHDAVAPVGRLARARSLEHPELAAALDDVRHFQADQTRLHFAPELAARAPAARVDLVGSLTTLTSFESWDQLRTGMGRTGRQVQRAWVAGVRALLAP